MIIFPQSSSKYQVVDSIYQPKLFSILDSCRPMCVLCKQKQLIKVKAYYFYKITNTDLCT